MAELSDMATCLGIDFVTRHVDPIEVVAEHPYMRDVVLYEFEEPFEVIERLAYLVDEFGLSPEDILKAHAISQLALREGEFNG